MRSGKYVQAGVSREWFTKLLPGTTLAIVFLVPAMASAQRATENAVAEASDAFGTTVGAESIGLYTSNNARGFDPSQAGNLRVNGLYFDQAPTATPNDRMVRGNTIHVGISAQGYAFPAPTGVVDYDLRVPGNEFVTSVLAGYGALFRYSRPTIEVDTQIPVIKDVLSIGGGFGYKKNTASQNAVSDYLSSAAGIVAWSPNDAISIISFWSGSKTGTTGGDRPRVVIGDNEAPTNYRQTDVGDPKWVYFGYFNQNYGAVATANWSDWTLRAGIFRSDSTNPKTFTAFLLNTDSAGRGTFAIEGLPSRYTRSTSGEVRASRTFSGTEQWRNTVSLNIRARDRESIFGGGDRRVFGAAAIGAIPDVPQPTYQLGPTTSSHTQQITGGAEYDGVWRDVGQLSLGLQKTDYQRTITVPGGVPVTGKDSPWLYNASAAAYLLPQLAIYTGYTRGLEELGTAPNNAANRDEAVPAALTRQIDAGIRYRFRPNLQLVFGGFMIDKPYYGLDSKNLYRELGDVRHSGLEFSLTGTLTEEFTVVAGAVLLRPRITSVSSTGTVTHLTSVGPIPRLLRGNLQYRPHQVKGLAFDLKVESISSSYLNVANTRRVSGAITADAGVRYTTKLADVPVRFRLQGYNLGNAFYITPNSSGLISASEARRVELTIAADF